MDLGERTQSTFDEFCWNFTDYFISKFQGNIEFEDNHLRLQRDFASPCVEAIKYEENWVKELGEKYKLLGEPKRLNVSRKRVPFETRLGQLYVKRLVEFYKQDYLDFSYTPPYGLSLS